MVNGTLTISELYLFLIIFPIFCDLHLTLGSVGQPVGRINPDNPNDWEPIPGEKTDRTSDKNDFADNIEEYEENTAILKQLEIELNAIKDNQTSSVAPRRLSLVRIRRQKKTPTGCCLHGEEIIKPPIWITIRQPQKVMESRSFWLRLISLCECSQPCLAVKVSIQTLIMP